jgi:acetyl esterase
VTTGTAAGPLSPASSRLLRRLEASGAPPACACTIEEIRARLAAMRKVAGAAPELAGTHDRPVAGVAARTYEPVARVDDTLVLFLHGGGWSSGTLDDYDVPCARLAAGLGRAVVSLGYRLAPEQPYPAAVEDCDAAMRQLVAGHASIVIIGESAGANLAAVVTGRAATERRAEAIRLQVLIYPVTDALVPLAAASSADGPRLPVDAEEIRMFWDLYVPDGVDRSHADLSPARAPVPAGLPRTQVWLAGLDPVRDQGQRFADALATAGVEVDVRTWPEEFHGFLTMGELIPAAAPAWSDVVAATAAALAQG